MVEKQLEISTDSLYKFQLENVAFLAERLIQNRLHTTLASVSYTHLDVYKRQKLTCTNLSLISNCTPKL